ncbi:hypothetical protein AWB68_02154 [Caballeronia choica]|uniref:Uncharacterized protein n=1 Tax=Caballeronia choica TaxID=326476 RepID=A0A158HLW9_9BURK|nr:hypothetical protein AWB68_02154 [Caballeronia choica]
MGERGAAEKREGWGAGGVGDFDRLRFGRGRKRGRSRSGRHKIHIDGVRSRRLLLRLATTARKMIANASSDHCGSESPRIGG